MNRTRLKKLSLGGLLMLTFSGASFAQGAEIRVCDRPNLNGECLDLRHGVADLRGFGMANRVTSFDIRRGTWILCSEPGFAGRCVPFDASVDNLRRSGFNNTVASLRPVRGGGSGDAWQRRSITLYERPNYQGRGWTFADDEPDLARYALGDRISSVRVTGGGRWNLCFDANYQRCREITGSVPRLRDIGMNNTISSIQEVAMNAPGRPDDERRQAVLYEDSDFRGASVAVGRGGTPSLARFDFDNRVSSLRLPPGEQWVVCSNAAFRGACVTLSGDVPNLSQFNMNDRATSIRRVRR